MNKFRKALHMLVLAALSLSYAAAQNADQTKPLSKITTTANQPNRHRELDLQNAIATPRTWSEVNWSQPRVLDSSKWIPKDTLENGPNGNVLTHEFKSSAFGLKDVNFVRWRSGDQEKDVMFALNAQVNFKSCANLALLAGKNLGNPIASNESTRLYFSESNYVELVSQIWQWTVGGTRLTSSCLGVTSAEKKEDEKLTVSVMYEPVALREELRPSFLLRCTRSLSVNMTSERRQLSDLVFWVSASRPQTIRSTKLAILGEENSTFVDDFQISFKMKNSESMKSNYSIDRVSGQLSVDVVEQGRPFGKITGNCVKVDDPKKF